MKTFGPIHPNCIYYPADHECLGEATHYVVNRDGKIRPLCKDCSQIRNDVHKWTPEPLGFGFARR